MRIHISFAWMKWISVEVTIPRLGLFAPGDLPASFEALETWSPDD
jgi:hypothetical protein